MVDCTDPQKMLEYLEGTVSTRKLRLFTTACARLFWAGMTDPMMREVVETAERYADGVASSDELKRSKYAVLALTFTGRTSERARGMGVTVDVYSCLLSLSVRCGLSTRMGMLDSWRHRVDPPGQHEPSLLRDLFGNPFRPPPPIDPAWLSWNGRTVEKLALAAYEERQLPSGHLDPHRLAVLADALEEAGCTDPAILGHLRQQGAVHVRGCHLLDRLLARE